MRRNTYKGKKAGIREWEEKEDEEERSKKRNPQGKGKLQAAVLWHLTSKDLFLLDSLQKPAFASGRFSFVLLKTRMRCPRKP